jgi:hypothetical protein
MAREPFGYKKNEKQAGKVMYKQVSKKRVLL